MGESLTTALSHAQERTAGHGGNDWHPATISDIETHDLDQAASPRAGPPQFQLTATLQDGTALDWHLPRSIRGNDTTDNVYRVGETVWVRERAIPAVHGGDTSVYCDTSGHWLLESTSSHQQRQSLLHRWGRVLTIAVLFLDDTLGVWRLILQLGLLLALSLVIEPAWPIWFGGLTILACQETALMIFD